MGLDEKLREDPLVVSDLGRGVLSLHHHGRVEAGLLRAALGGRAFAAGDLVTEHQQKERFKREVLFVGEHEPIREARRRGSRA